tara:strand:+ start:2030 stop:2329 length:300 start_codon:yes stop_codon:yes gene_type:complete
MSETEIDHSQDPRVRAIRAQTVFCCTNVDESYDDADLVEELDKENIKKPEDAVFWAFDLADLWADQLSCYEAGGDPSMGQNLLADLEKALKAYKKSLKR